MPNRATAQNTPKPSQKPVSRDMPKPSQKPSTQNMPKAKPVPSGDRGYGGGGGAQRPAAKPAQVNRPSPSAQPRPSKPTAMSGANRGGGNAKAASQRGKQSMPQGARSKGGGGGGKKKAR
jgi:hypothetical protein